MRHLQNKDSNNKSINTLLFYLFRQHYTTSTSLKPKQNIFFFFSRLRSLLSTLSLSTGDISAWIAYPLRNENTEMPVVNSQSRDMSGLQKWARHPLLNGKPWNSEIGFTNKTSITKTQQNQLNVVKQTEYCFWQAIFFVFYHPPHWCNICRQKKTRLGCQTCLFWYMIKDSVC